MKEMYITKRHGWLVIKVEGCEEMRYLWYSQREAISKYRKQFGLEHKKLVKVYM